VVKRIPENSPRRARRITKVKKGEKLFLSCFRPLRALRVLRGEKNSGEFTTKSTKKHEG
jgi:hypothetical protein